MDIELVVFNTEPKARGLRKAVRKVLACLSRTRFRRYACDLLALWKGGWIDSELPSVKRNNNPTVVMTVAHGDACWAAIRYARHHDLPLVTFFHDWWPDRAEVHGVIRPLVKNLFLNLYRKSSLALCISNGMKEELGVHENSKLLLPIPAKAATPRKGLSSQEKSRIKLCYFGSFGDYTSMLIQLMHEFVDHPHIKLEVRGDSSTVPYNIRKEMVKRKILLPFAPREELNEWLDTADAFLITQSFDEKHAKLMQTNFPSKLTEYAQFGKPLVIWGPEYGSAVKWARSANCGLVFDEPRVENLRLQLEQLCTDDQKLSRLSAATQAAAEKCFSPEQIQADFLRWVRHVSKN